MANSRKIVFTISESNEQPSANVSVSTTGTTKTITKYEPITSPQERSYELEDAMDDHIGSRKERE